MTVLRSEIEIYLSRSICTRLWIRIGFLVPSLFVCLPHLRLYFWSFHPVRICLATSVCRMCVQLLANGKCHWFSYPAVGTHSLHCNYPWHQQEKRLCIIINFRLSKHMISRQAPRRLFKNASKLQIKQQISSTIFEFEFKCANELSKELEAQQPANTQNPKCKIRLLKEWRAKRDENEH